MKRFARDNGMSRDNAVRSITITVIVFALILGLFVFGLNQINAGSAHHRKETLEEAINRDITVCYAEEGYYPENLAYIEKHYNLQYNKDEFFVDYEVRGANIRPYVTVIQKDGED